MESAPASIPPTTPRGLRYRVGRIDPQVRGEQVVQTADSANRSAGTRPAVDTRFGSSAGQAACRTDWKKEIS